MAIVAGVVFFVIRAALALVPAFATRRPIKKWSALAALLAAAAYLVISGAEVATQRAFIMTAIVLIGVMADRAALTLAHARGRGLRGADPGAAGAGASELPDVVCGDARADRRLRAQPALATQCRHDSRRAHRAVGRQCRRRPDPRLAGRGPRHHALRRVPLPSARALRRDRQPDGDADRLDLGDADRPAGAARHSVRVRRLPVAADGRGDRLDDGGRALGREPAGRGRAHAGVRHRTAAGLHRRSGRALPAQDAAALVRSGH